MNYGLSVGEGEERTHRGFPRIDPYTCHGTTERNIWKRQGKADRCYLPAPWGLEETTTIENLLVNAGKGSALPHTTQGWLSAHTTRALRSGAEGRTGCGP